MHALSRIPIATDALPVPPLRLIGRAIPSERVRVAGRNPRARSATLRGSRAHRSGPLRMMVRLNLFLLSPCSSRARCRWSLRATRRASSSSSSSASRRRARAYDVEYGQLQLEQSDLGDAGRASRRSPASSSGCSCRAGTRSRSSTGARDEARAVAARRAGPALPRLRAPLVFGALLSAARHALGRSLYLQSDRQRVPAGTGFVRAIAATSKFPAHRGRIARPLRRAARDQHAGEGSLGVAGEGRGDAEAAAARSPPARTARRRARDKTRPAAMISST